MTIFLGILESVGVAKPQAGIRWVDTDRITDEKDIPF